MSDLAVTDVRSGRGRTALAVAALSLVLFIGGGFTVGGIFWILGAVVGLGAVVLGVAARRNARAREATVAVILGAIPVVWFAAFMLVAAFDS